MTEQADLPRILIIEDDPDWQSTISRFSRILGYDTEIATDYTSTQMKLQVAEEEQRPFIIATIDMNFEVDDTEFNLSTMGEQLLKYIKENYPYTACIVISGYGTPDRALDLRDNYDLDYYIHKDFMDAFPRGINRALERTQARRQLAQTCEDCPSVFISYQRSSNWSHARAIATSLREHNVEVFLDLDNINEGEFSKKIADEIKRCDYFVPICSASSLKSEWVQYETTQALLLEKKIIPLLIDDYELQESDLSVPLKALSSLNSIKLGSDLYDARIEMLVKRFLG